MGILYLIDAFNPFLPSSDINDVVIPRNGEAIPVHGAFVVRVPDGVSVADPTDVTDLLTKKHLSILAQYAYLGVANITYDDLLDSLNLDPSVPGTDARFGDRVTVAINPGGQIATTTIPLASTPAQAVVTWETSTWTMDDPRDGRFVRSYLERDPDSVSTCEITFDGGAHVLTTTNGALVNIPPVAQGNQFLMRLTSTHFEPLGLGGWAVIY